MQFLNKLDIYCLIIFTRFNLFLSCFVLLLLLLLGYFIYMQLTLCFMVYLFLFFSFLHDQALNVSLHIIIIHKDKTTFLVLPLRGIIEPMLTSFKKQTFQIHYTNLCMSNDMNGKRYTSDV